MNSVGKISKGEYGMRKSRNKILFVTAFAFAFTAFSLFATLGVKNAAAEGVYGVKSANGASNEAFSASDYAERIVKSCGAAANYTANEKQPAAEAVYSGIKLTGGAGATFELGYFIVNNDKFYWGSGERDAANTSADGAFMGKRQGFLTFVYAPNAAAKEISRFVVTLSDVNNGNEYVSFMLSEQFVEGRGKNSDKSHK